jgi:branched-chain amino acid transport system substrate-binding protein
VRLRGIVPSTTAALFAALVASDAGAQQGLKIGLIMTYSGQFADAALQIDNAVKLYVKQHGDLVAGRKIAGTLAASHPT